MNVKRKELMQIPTNIEYFEYLVKKEKVQRQTNSSLKQ